MSAWHLRRARQASLDRHLRWCDLISLSTLPGALASLAFPIYAARWPEPVDNAFALCLAVNALWPLLVAELVWRRQVRMRIESLSGGQPDLVILAPFLPILPTFLPVLAPFFSELTIT